MSNFKFNRCQSFQVSVTDRHVFYSETNVHCLFPVDKQATQIVPLNVPLLEYPRLNVQT